MEQALGYIRVSTDQQDFERQREEITLYAKRMGFLLVKVFEDKQTGSTYEDRKGFQALLSYFEENPHIKILILDEVSRLGREVSQQVSTYKALSRQGVRIFTRGGGEFEKSKEGSLLFNLLSVIAEYEKQTIIDRTGSGRRNIVRGGNTQISHRPYGYSLILTERKNREVLKRQGIEINETEAPHVREMFSIIQRGGSVFSVLQYLTRNKVKPMKSEKWGKSSVLRILHSSLYYGEWKWGKYFKNGKSKHSLSRRPDEELLTVKVPAIITKEIFDGVQEKLSKNRELYNPKNQKQLFIFKGMIRCHCGKTMQSLGKTSKNARQYRCPQRTIQGYSLKTCPIHAIDAMWLELILLDALRSKIESDDFLKEEREAKLQKIDAPRKTLEARKIALTHEIEKARWLLKGFIEKSVGIVDEEKSKAFDELSNAKSKELATLKSEMEYIEEELAAPDMQIDFSSFDKIKLALSMIRDEEVKDFDTSARNKIAFVREYIESVSLTYNKDKTDFFLSKVANEPKKNLLYQLNYSRIGEIKRTAFQAFTFIVKLYNGYEMEIEAEYLHKNPKILSSYLFEEKQRDILRSNVPKK